MNERDAYILDMRKKANALVKNYSWSAYKELWDMSSEWNGTHDYDEEIFMCEIGISEGYSNGGFMIEDDYWLFEN